MRSTRRVRYNVIGLTKYLEALFDRDEILEQMGGANGASPLSEAKFALAVAGTNHSAALRKGLEARGADRILQHLDEQAVSLAITSPPVTCRKIWPKSLNCVNGCDGVMAEG